MYEGGQSYYEGGAVIAHKARLLIACGGRGGREHPPLPYIQSNACRFLFLLFSYLRFAEAASFDKKELRRSCTLFKALKTLSCESDNIKIWERSMWLIFMSFINIRVTLSTLFVCPKGMLLYWFPLK
jgi:hypothetical protein